MVVPWKRHVEGEEAPSTGGVLKFRFPGIHVRYERPELVMSLFLFVTSLAIIPAAKTCFPWLSFDNILAAVFIYNFVYWVHPFFGCATVPGWITPAIPITVAFLVGVPEEQRLQAFTALGIIVGVIMLILGVFRAASWLQRVVPMSIRAGVVLGAGIAAIMGEIKVGGRFVENPIMCGVGSGLAILLLYSLLIRRGMAGRPRLSIFIAYAFTIALIGGAVAGLVVGEAEWTKWAYTTKALYVWPDFGEAFGLTSGFFIGWGSPGLWAMCIPTAIVLYIIAFGDWILWGTFIGDAKKSRPDEVVPHAVDRSHIINAMRNIVGCIIPGHVGYNGPLWTGLTVAVYERYKLGRLAMFSIFGACTTYVLTHCLFHFFAPFVDIITPFLPMALDITMMVTGFACIYTAALLIRNRVELGVAGVMGVTLALYGAAWALGVGIVLHLLLIGWRRLAE